jgi:SulP family sulfate permease
LKPQIKYSVFPFLKWFPMVNRNTIKADLLAGITGAIVVLPQGVAFAMIAGLPPIYGLYTAMVTPIIAALFGSSWHLISGPTTAISIVVFASASGYAEPGSAEYIQIVLTITLLAGLFQLALGLARMGTLVNFVSHSVVTGFTAGAALLIAVNQLKHALGMQIPRGLSFYETLIQIGRNTAEVNPYAISVAVITLITAIIIKKFLPAWPNLLVGMIVGSIVAMLLGAEENSIPLVESLPSNLPPFAVPEVSLDSFRALSPNAFAIALLGLIEAVAIGRAIASKSHQQIDGNQEFVGQGMSNIVGSFFSCYAGSGSFTRSGINYQAGARTPMAAIVAAIILALILMLVAPLASYLPIAAMGGVILLVAYNLIDFHYIKQILKASKREAVVMTITFLTTLFLDLEFAIYFGVFFSLVFYLQKTSKPRIVTLAPAPDHPTRKFLNVALHPLEQCPQLKVIRIDGSIFFGAIEHISRELNEAQ